MMERGNKKEGCIRLSANRYVNIAYNNFVFYEKTDAPTPTKLCCGLKNKGKGTKLYYNATMLIILAKFDSNLPNIVHEIPCTQENVMQTPTGTN